VYGVSGAQPVELLHAALVKASAEAPPQVAAEGAACGPDRCG
jgi:hypothetical protein